MQLCGAGAGCHAPQATSQDCVILAAPSLPLCLVLVQGFDAAAECLQGLAQDYKTADSARPTTVTRLRPKGLTFL